jgi:hypothetical protein
MENKVMEALIKKFEDRVKDLLGPDYGCLIGIQQPEEFPIEERVGYVHILASSEKDINKPRFRTKYKTNGTVISHDVEDAIKEFFYLVIMDGFLKEIKNNH